MKQVVHTWVPHEACTRYISLDKCTLLPYWIELTFVLLFQNDDGCFSESGKKITFTFESPIAVRYSEEADREDLIHADVVDAASVAQDLVWPYFKVENSEFLQWQLDLHAAIGDPSELTCFGFTEEHYLFEILSNEDPVVKVD
ncbi:hypothetical protein VKA52_14605 [Halobacillus sp. HZG1]|uniref:hypothetical protein n=1 Tax=Halobacillus sp. HZG1 TaxID=3111769 RepID=UPI002DB996F9|nr:hypothetical protein [Halobacillus sp. HZG1]MEC3884964.1 hypothetical protein [Halobacillus sp. HZG1]